MTLAKGHDAESDVRATLQQVLAAALHSDTTVLDKLLADEFTRIQSDGKVLPKAKILEGIKSGTIKFVVFDESDVTVHVYGNTAVVISTGTITMRSPDGKEAGGKFTDSRVFVKRGGKWQVALFQSSKIT